MRGRTLYRIARPCLAVGEGLLRCLPAAVVAFGLLLARHIPTRLGVALRYIYLRRLARHCGDCVALFEGAYLHGVRHLSLGNNVSIHPLCYLDASGGLTIGDDVSIAHGTTIMTTEHDYMRPDLPIRDAPRLFAPVTIGSDVWIGAGVRILSGVTIGDHVVIGAGAVVTRDIPAHTLAVGVPARPLKRVKAEGPA